MLDVRPVPNQSGGHLKARKYCFFTRPWPGPPVIALVEVELHSMSECQGGECSEKGPKVLPQGPSPSATSTSTSGSIGHSTWLLGL